MRFPRNVVAGLVAAVVAISLVGCAAAANTAAAGIAAIPAGQLGGAFTAASTASAEQVLASAGVATVSGEKSTTPLVAVTGTVRVTFTTAQVRAMAREAADHGGISGATLDATSTVPSGVPPVAYLLAAWVKDAKTPGAVAMRKAMGTGDWTKSTWTDATQIVFPTIALPLFTADVIASLPAATNQPSGLGRGGSDGSASVREAAYVTSNTLNTAVAGVFSSVCSSVSGFIQGVINSVFSALQFSDSGTGGVGGFFKTVWNGAIGLAQQAVQGLISAVTGPVLNAIKTIAGTAAVIAQIVSYVKPWSVKVTADPASVDAGSGGTLTATVDTGTDGADYPSSVKDCASAIGVTLPALTAADAKAVWNLSGAIGTSDDTNVTLDSHGAGSLSFTSTKSEAGATCDSAGDSQTVGTAGITVTRPDTDGVKQLATSLLTNGLGTVGSVIGPVVSSIVSPIFDQVLAQVSALTDVSGSTTVSVTEPASGSGSGCDNAGGKAGNDSQPTKAPAAACMVGTWKTTSVVFHIPSGTETGLVGATWTITDMGKMTAEFNGSSPLMVDGTPAPYGGTTVDSIELPSASATSGPLMEYGVLEDNMTIGGVPVAGTTYDSKTAAAVGTWTCSGDDLTITLTPDPVTEDWDFARAG